MADPVRWLALLAILSCSPGEQPAADPQGASRQPIARLDGELIYADEVEPSIAFQIYRRRVDIYSLLKGATEDLVDERVLARAAARRGITPEELLRREVDEVVEPVTDQEVERYLEEHLQEAAAAGDQARPRVRHYLSETRKIERRLALLAELRAQSGFELLLEPPSPPRTRVDIAGAPARGSPEAPVTVVHFATFSSPHSARSFRHLEKLRGEFPRAFRWVHRNFLNDRDEMGLLAAEVGVVAQRLGRFWEFHDGIFALDGRFDEAALAEVAERAGLGRGAVEEARAGLENLDRVKGDIDAAVRAGARREPTLFVNGRYFSGLYPFERLRELFVEELGAVANSSH